MEIGNLSEGARTGVSAAGGIITPDAPPSPWQADWETGLSHYKADRDAEALPFFVAAWEKGRGDYALLHRLRYCFEVTGQAEEGVAFFRRQTERDPEQYAGWAELGHLLMRLEREGEARTAYAEADRLGARERYGEALLAPYGHACSRTGDFAAARPLLEEAERLAPDDWKVCAYLAYLNQKERRFEEALSYHARAAAVAADDAFSPTQAARLLLSLDRPREAVPLLEEALRRVPDHDEARDLLASARMNRLPRPLLPFARLLFRVRWLWRTLEGDTPFAPNDKPFQEFAAFARRRCREWFGEGRWKDGTADGNSPVAFLEGPTTGAVPMHDDRRFLVFMHPGFAGNDGRFATAGHELCHCATANRPRAFLHRRHVWVDEMLVDRAAYHLLRERGRGDLAEAHLRSVLDSDTRLPHRRMLRARRSIWGIWASGTGGYPRGFGRAVTEIGLALEEAVGWGAMRRMVACRTFDEWLATLPSGEARDRARRLLEHGPEPRIEKSASGAEHIR